MARVMLIMPRLPQKLGAPYLGQQYVAASLLDRGHEVRALDMAAVRWCHDDEHVAQEVERWGPDLIGMTLFTWNAARGYRLAERLRGVARMMVAGGAHPTVCAEEPLQYGFDVSVKGEGELALVALAEALDGRGQVASIPGVVTRAGEGRPREVIEDLDALPLPMGSYGLYDPGWYSAGALVVPGGMMTSRGCPARCTFCANYVTGRAFRWRSAGNVVKEMLRLSAEHGLRHFSFWDDAFTARRDRLDDLCAAIVAEEALRGVTWTCITPANMVKPGDLEKMARAGCVGVNFGIESGDPTVLKIIQKGQRPTQVREAVAVAKAEGMVTIVNFMFGFPGEGVEGLGETLGLMEALSSDVDYFNNRGVLIPFPGTSIYDEWKGVYGFERWWLEPGRIVDEPDLSSMDGASAMAALEHDPTLDQDFFKYSDEVRERIEDCVRFKARHNARARGV